MIVYVSGSIRPVGSQTLRGNLDAAKEVAMKLWREGYTVICPHANTDLPIELAELESGIDWIAGDLEMLARCDAVVVVPDSEQSVGTNTELAFAMDHHIPIYYWPDMPTFPQTEIDRPEQCEMFINTVMDMYRVHLKKNADYSPANIQGTGELGIVVRMWDKIARIMNLTGFRIEIAKSFFAAPLKPQNESLDDAYMDVAVYGIIGMINRAGKWGR
jgi:hypothetical protein